MNADTLDVMNHAPTHILSKTQAHINQALERCLPLSDIKPVRLHQAMRYAVLDGGKRLRPALVYATGAALGLAPDKLNAPACAVELIHAYSLIHDDLPAMDDDDLRRGKPTCHKAFDEATAILAGDALQVLAFQQLADETQFTPQQRIQMISALTKACGSIGMAGGQAMDLAATGQAHSLSIDELETLYRYKTGYLIRASIELTAIAAPSLSTHAFKQLMLFADAIGLAFQIQDDILDIEASTEILGKQQGADTAKQKTTYPGLMGIDAAKAKVQTLHQEAIQHLTIFGASAKPLHDLADYIICRGY